MKYSESLLPEKWRKKEMKKEIVFKDPGIFAKDIVPIIKEDLRQIEKWGIQEVSPFEWLAYLAEEVGELAKAIIEFVYWETDKKNISEEAIQIATLALKISKMAEEFKE